MGKTQRNTPVLFQNPAIPNFSLVSDLDKANLSKINEDRYKSAPVEWDLTQIESYVLKANRYVQYHTLGPYTNIYFTTQI